MSGTFEEQDAPAPFVPVPVGEMFGEPYAHEGRPRSGYARIRSRFRRVVGHYEELQAQYTALQRHHEALKVGHAELQAAFDELLDIHNGLLGDLKQSRQVRSATHSFPLMGSRHG